MRFLLGAVLPPHHDHRNEPRACAETSRDQPAHPPHFFSARCANSNKGGVFACAEKSFPPHVCLSQTPTARGETSKQWWRNRLTIPSKGGFGLKSLARDKPASALAARGSFSRCSPAYHQGRPFREELRGSLWRKAAASFLLCDCRHPVPEKKTGKGGTLQTRDREGAGGRIAGSLRCQRAKFVSRIA